MIFDKFLEFHNRESTVSSTNNVGKSGYQQAKNDVGPLPYSIQKQQQQKDPWIREVTTRPMSIHLLEENIVNKTQTLSLPMIFFKGDIKRIGDKSKKNKTNQQKTNGTMSN